jgi:hypothetical protein
MGASIIDNEFIEYPLDVELIYSSFGLRHWREHYTHWRVPAATILCA